MTITTKFLFFLIPAFFIGGATTAQMQFIENKGQWDNKIKYKGDLKNGAFFLENTGFTVLLQDTNDLKKIQAYYHGEMKNNTSALPITNNALVNTTSPLILHSHAYKVNFLGSNNNILQIPDKITPEYNNYFIGNDNTKWASNCKIYQAVTYKNVYPNIDVRYYTDNNQLKYDLVVHPGGNPNAIAMRYDGADKLNIVNKELLIGTSVGEVKELYPYTYQTINDTKIEVDCKYTLSNNVLSFKVKNYDATQTLVIDPTIIFSSFTGSTADNWGYTATPAPDGSVFAAGIVFGTGFPSSAGAYQTVFNGGPSEDGFGGYDIAIFKFSATGSQRLYATYLGGNKGNEQPHSLICDAQGNLILAGRSSSSDYPIKTNQTNVSGSNYDIVITKLNATGTAIIGSIKIGGDADDGINIKSKEVAVNDNEIRNNYGDDARGEIIIDAAGNIWLSSCTQSSTFPTVNAFQTTNKGGNYNQDGVILKLNSDLSSLLFSSYFGGSGDDACFVIAQNPLTGNMYVGGSTISSDLPGNTTNTIGAANAGMADGFVTEFTNVNPSLIKTTYIGTNGTDMVFGLKFDKFGFPYIMGTTTGAWPVINATFSQPSGKQFICKMQPDLSAYVYSTCFGTGASTPNISPVAFLVDRCQNVYVSGWGGGLNLNYPNAGTLGLTEVNPLPGIPAADGKDFYFFVLEKNAQSQLFGSHFGEGFIGSLGDHVDGGTSRFDANGVIYQAVCACKNIYPYPATNPTFPTTAGAWSNVINSIDCNQAIVKIQMNFAGVAAEVKALINGEIDSIGCVPLKISFVDTLASGKMYIWHYSDPASPKDDTTYAPNASASHIYNNIGTYKVRLIAIDSSTCNVADTAYVTVKVGNNNVTPNFTFTKLDSCASLRFQFNNTTTAVLPVYTNKTFTWDFGDGSPRINMANGNIIHSFPAVGSYTVTLFVSDTTFCNSPDSIQQTIRLNPNVKAVFKTSATGCVPYIASFTNNSLGGLSWLWQFGDGDTSTAYQPTHLYNTIGTYNVRLIAYDSTTCNKIDTSAYFGITVSSIPIAGFTWTPNPPVQNVITQFTNTSIGATRYTWYFGDGDSSNLINPAHQYNTTDTFHVVLISYNDANCADTFKANVPVIIVPILAVPNAFTPGKFANGAYNNSIIKVQGFGIANFQWKIYNRWGQVVFATTDLSQAWDGTFKGQPQPMDVYTYTLEAKFTTGQVVKKTGDITLLR